MKSSKKLLPVFVFILCSIFSSVVVAEEKVDKNTIYGMYSGLALLMDVYYPEKPNGYGVIYISGSGWHAPLAYNARPLKESGQVKQYAKPLVEAGYVVFAINHRAAPRFKYPAAVEDVQRAVRFIRYNAQKYAINPDRIGGVGGSSGGHLVSMLGVLDGHGNPDDLGPVNQVSAKLNCIVARAAPTDFISSAKGGGAATTTSFMGMRFPRNAKKGDIEFDNYWQASPINHITPDDPPILLMHGDKDEIVSFEQSVKMEMALQKAGVTTKLLRVPGGGHGGTFGNVKNSPDYIGEMLNWLKKYLIAQN
jgi:acetyl esterase/lipase